MKTIFVALLLVGIFTYYLNMTYTPSAKEVEYRYLPRTWQHQLDDNAFSKKEIFKQMYDSETGNVWLQAYQNQKLV